MLKNWSPGQARTPISMITSKYDETFFFLITLKAAKQDAIYSTVW